MIKFYFKRNKETQASGKIKKYIYFRSLNKKITGLIFRLLVKITNLSIQWKRFIILFCYRECIDFIVPLIQLYNLYWPHFDVTIYNFYALIVLFNFYYVSVSYNHKGHSWKTNNNLFLQSQLTFALLLWRKKFIMPLIQLYNLYWPHFNVTLHNIMIWMYLS